MCPGKRRCETSSVLTRSFIVYHFMFDPRWDEGCKSCSYFADNFSHAIFHLAAADTAFAVVSRASLAKVEAFKRRDGVDIPMVLVVQE